MRTITHIVVHCSATPQTTTVQSIRNYWKNVLKWSRPGYHYIIEANGTETQLSSIANMTNGVAGRNATSIHVCYVGGVDGNGKPIDNRTEAQKRAIATRLTALKTMFPHAQIVGHRDLSPDRNKNGIIEMREWVKSCPCFDAIEEYKNIS
jgi:N-acetylmuramoyl-L-alanine amidase